MNHGGLLELEASFVVFSVQAHKADLIILNRRLQSLIRLSPFLSFKISNQP